jgi:hypothetical protein
MPRWNGVPCRGSKTFVEPVFTVFQIYWSALPARNSVWKVQKMWCFLNFLIFWQRNALGSLLHRQDRLWWSKLLHVFWQVRCFQTGDSTVGCRQANVYSALQIQLAQVATVYQITVYLSFNGADTYCFDLFRMLNKNRNVLPFSSTSDICSVQVN